MGIFKRRPYKLKSYKSRNYIRKRRHKRIFISLIILLVMLVGGFVVLENKGVLKGALKNIINKKEIEKPLVSKGSLVDYKEQPAIKMGIHGEEKAPIKGIYVSESKAGSQQINELIDLCKRTELNAMVIDVKSDSGNLTFSTDNNIIRQAGIVPDRVPIKDIDYLIEQLYLNNIYPIGRLVTFKDNIIKEQHPEFLIKKTDGSFYESNEPGGQKATWINPYNRDSWEYILSVGKEVAKVGFKEIQLDYVRFHEGMSSDIIDFGFDSKEKNKTQIINEFIKYFVGEMHKEEVKVSADVFGAIITSSFDAEIVGQDYVELSRHLDYISPMVYPSHYAPNSFGVENPDLDPYNVLLGSMLASKKELSSIEEEDRAIVRPWLQDFTARWIPVYKEYGPEEIRNQINGVYDAGLDEWLLWNAANRYTEEGLLAQ